MKLECNIDQKGRRIRIIAGVLTDLVGVGVLLYGILAGGLTFIVVGGILSAWGAFMVFEGVRGWCIARALGIKTPR